MPDDQDFESFWARENRARIVLETLKELHAARGIAAERLQRIAVKNCSDPAYAPHPQTMRRILDGKRDGFQKMEQYSGLLVALSILLQNDHPNDPPGLALRREQIAEILTRHEDRFPQISKETLRKQAKRTDTITPSLVAGAMEFMRGLGIDRARLSDVYSEMFMEADEPAARFMCYRYHSKPGQVVKSFLIIRAPNPAYGISVFSNFVYDSNSNLPRRVEGIVLPMREHIYLLGPSIDGSGLKIILMNRSRPSKRYYSLLMSMDEDFAPICARFVLVRTKFQDHESAGMGIYDEVALEGEISEFRESMKNVIPFRLLQNVVFDGRELEQSAMVDEVRRLLLGEGGEARMTLGGQPFNPAASSQYPYNAALGIGHG